MRANERGVSFLTFVVCNNNKLLSLLDKHLSHSFYCLRLPKKSLSLQSIWGYIRLKLACPESPSSSVWELVTITTYSWFDTDALAPVFWSLYVYHKIDQTIIQIFSQQLPSPPRGSTPLFFYPLLIPSSQIQLSLTIVNWNKLELGCKNGQNFAWHNLQ